MTNETRIFEQRVYVEEPSGKTVVARHYTDTGVAEFWAVLALHFQNGQQKGSAQVPFKIEAENITDAFAKHDATMAEVEPGARQNVEDELKRRHKQEASKIVLANSIPAIPITH
jgi:hypothetical protein